MEIFLMKTYLTKNNERKKGQTKTQLKTQFLCYCVIYETIHIYYAKIFKTIK